MPVHTESEMRAYERAAALGELQSRSPADRELLLMQLRTRRNETDRGKRVTPMALTWNDLEDLAIDAKRLNREDFARTGQTAATAHCPAGQVSDCLYHSTAITAPPPTCASSRRTPASSRFRISDRRLHYRRLVRPAVRQPVPDRQL